VKRTKSLLRDIIAAKAQVFWVAQISANLLRDEELVDLIAASGGKWIFIGMESIDPVNLKGVNKGFNKPGEYAAVLERLAKRNIYAITSFIFGTDNDTPGVAERTLQQVRTWPPGLPIFGLLTPLPATPLYKRLEAAGRLTRPRHWLDFVPFTNGVHSTENDDRRSTCRAELRLGSLLQPGSNGSGSCRAGRSACGGSRQYFPRASLFSRNLFSDAEEVVVAAGRCREPPNDSEAVQGGSIPMDAPTKFCQSRPLCSHRRG
jgi:hypothetical protein